MESESIRIFVALKGIFDGFFAFSTDRDVENSRLFS